MSSTPRRALHDEDTEQLARDLREQVRALNYATMGSPGLTLPGTAYSVLGNLHEAEHMLAQALGQLDHFLAHELAAGRLGHDSGQAPDEAIDEVRYLLVRAQTMARNLSMTIGQAQNAIAFIHAQPASPASDPCSTLARTINQDFPQPLGDTLRGPDPEDPRPPRPDRSRGPKRPG